MLIDPDVCGARNTASSSGQIDASAATKQNNRHHTGLRGCLQEREPQMESAHEPQPQPSTEQEPLGPNASAAADEAFIESNKFVGAKPGYVFANRSGKVGYHLDDSSSGDSPAPGWTSTVDREAALEAVPAMTTEEIIASEAAEKARVAEHVARLGSLTTDEFVAEIFQNFDGDGDGTLDMDEYGRFLQAISYSKKWTETQWAKECELLGTDA
eukprot:SAG31_NODE_15090_length_771_cov_1.434524_1_plen_212_part_01